MSFFTPQTPVQIAQGKSADASRDLILACIRKDEAAVMDALQRNADPNARGPEGSTPLIYLATYKNRNGEEADAFLADVLVTHGADQSIANQFGRNAYMVSMFSRNLSLIEYFERQRVDMNLKDRYGISAAAERAALISSSTRVAERLQRRV